MARTGLEVTQIELASKHLFTVSPFTLYLLVLSL